MCVCGRDYLFQHFRHCPRIVLTVQAMQMEQKMEQDPLPEERIAELLDMWDRQLALANCRQSVSPEPEDGEEQPAAAVVEMGWETPDQEMWETPPEMDTE